MEKLRKHLPTLLLAALCVLMLLSFLRIGDLENQVRRLDHELSNMDSNLRNEMSRLVYDVDQTLEREASLLSDAVYEVGALDVGTLTVPVTVRITPKEQRPATSLSLEWAGECISLTREGVGYTAVLPLPVDGTLERPSAVITEGETRYVETLDWYIVPMDYVRIYADVRIHQTQYEPSYKITGPVEVSVDKYESENVSAVELVTLLNGTEQRRDSVPCDVADAWQWHGSWTPEDFEFDIDRGDKLEIYLEVTTGGLIWRYAAEIVSRDDDGRIQEADIYRGEPLSVATTDGRVISFLLAEEYGY